MKKTLLLASALIAPAIAGAQTSEQVALYSAVANTPAGALAPLLTNTLLDRIQNGASLAIRYGNLARGDLNPVNHGAAITGVIPAGLGSSVALTAGVSAADCANCDPQLMLGLGGDIRLVSSRLGTTATSPVWTVSLDGEIGYANADPGSFISGRVGVPIALVQRGNGMQFVPFITPAFILGQVSSAGVSESGSGLAAGGGLGIYRSESSLTINVGAQHQFVKGAKTAVGINVMFGGK